MKRSLLYKALRDEALGKMPYLNFFDLQKDQVKTPQQFYPIPFPALLIELGNADFSQLAEFHQKGAMPVSFYLYLDNVTDSFDGAEQEQQTIEMLDRIDDVYQVFEGFCIEGMTPLVRIRDYMPVYGTRLAMYRIDFTTMVDDHKEIETRHVKLNPEFIRKNTK